MWKLSGLWRFVVSVNDCEKQGGGEDGFDCTVERVQLWKLEDPVSDGIDQGQAVRYFKRDGSCPRRG